MTENAPQPPLAGLRPFFGRVKIIRCGLARAQGGDMSQEDVINAANEITDAIKAANSDICEAITNLNKCLSEMEKELYIACMGLSRLVNK